MGRMDKDLEEARAFALKYCNPDDSDIISDLDRHARETAWALLQRIKHLEGEKCICEECGCEVEEIEEEYEHTPEEQEDVKEEEEKGEVVNESSDPSTLEKLSEISANNKELIKKVTKTVAGAGVMVATTQTAAAATPTLTAATAMFFQEAGKKIATIGTAGVMSIGSGAYFQAKTAKAEGIEIAVVTEQEYGIFSKVNGFTESIIGVSTFGSVRTYAEEGYGDVEGTGPAKDEEAEEKEGLSEEEQSKRAEEASKLRIEMDEKGILKIKDDELEEDTPVTPVPKVTDL